MAKLPVELIEYIIDHAAEDPAMLKECALINSTCLARCRVHQFQVIVLEAPITYFRLQSLIEEAPHLAKLTTCLVLMTIAELEDDNRPFPILQILDHLPNARALSIHPQSSSSWIGMSSSTREAIFSAISLPSITFVSLRLWLNAPDGHEVAQSLIRRCAGNKTCHLTLSFLTIDLTRATASDGPVTLDSLVLHDVRRNASVLVPRTLPLLDLSTLTSLDLSPSGYVLSHRWMSAIARHCSQVLQTFVWRPTVFDLTGKKGKYFEELIVSTQILIQKPTLTDTLYPLSQLPVLQHLHIDVKGRGYLQFTAPFLLRLLDSRSSGQVLKSLMFHCDYIGWDFYGSTEDYFETFEAHFKDLLQGMTNIGRTVIVLAGVERNVTELQSNQRALLSSWIEEVYPGSSCVLEFESN